MPATVSWLPSSLVIEAGSCPSGWQPVASERVQGARGCLMPQSRGGRRGFPSNVDRAMIYGRSLGEDCGNYCHLAEYGLPCLPCLACLALLALPALLACLACLPCLLACLPCLLACLPACLAHLPCPLACLLACLLPCFLAPSFLLCILASLLPCFLRLACFLPRPCEVLILFDALLTRFVRLWSAAARPRLPEAQEVLSSQRFRRLKLLQWTRQLDRASLEEYQASALLVFIARARFWSKAYKQSFLCVRLAWIARICHRARFGGGGGAGQDIKQRLESS